MGFADVPRCLQEWVSQMFPGVCRSGFPRCSQVFAGVGFADAPRCLQEMFPDGDVPTCSQMFAGVVL